MNVQKQAEKMEKKQRSLWQEAWRRFKRNKSAMIGLVFFAALIVIAIEIGRASCRERVYVSV